ncbi:NAD-dependent epimerase/dehydratase family protein [Akkermansiaceae bacterium]|nr:NAD-dependent epimerase/dehydratase family protein [Akkermansiaceae bacterium]
MRILITGGAGFIGSHLVEHFQSSAEVVVLDNLRSGYLANLEGLSHTFIQGSVTDRASVDVAMKGVDLVYHLAAMISVPESMNAPRECVETNVLGLINVLESAAEFGVKKVVLASSAAIYGDNPTVPKTEEMKPEPKSPYAVSKLDGEYYLEIFRREGKLNTASLRFFNVFGPRQDPKSVYAAAVPIFIQRALRGEAIIIYGDGEQTRDFIYVKDVVKALAHIASSEDAKGVFNVGYGNSITVNQLAEEIIIRSRSKSKLIYKSGRSGDVKHSRACVARLRKSGYQVEGDLLGGLSQTIASFKDPQSEEY